MNDRFDAQLREHLLVTADTRPADGQLEGVLQAVSGTAQRQKVVARLTWFPGRIGPVPTRPLRYALVAAALVATMAAAALLVGSGPTRSTPFEGTWISIDPGDGSTQALVVGAGMSPDVNFVDYFATGLACRDDSVKVFTADGKGTVVAGDRLEITWPSDGGCGLRLVHMDDLWFDYRPATDSLRDNNALDWQRSRESDPAPPSRGPDTPGPNATLTSDCIQFDRPDSYTGPAGGLAVTVDVGSVGQQWSGSRSRFALINEACTGGSGTGRITAAEVISVMTDACNFVDVRVSSSTEAAAAVYAAKGLQVVREERAVLGGYTGTRLDVIVSEEPNTCPDGVITVADGLGPFDPTLIFSLYLVDVESFVLAVAVPGYPVLDDDVSAQVGAILGSMQIVPVGVPTPTVSGPEPTAAGPEPTGTPTGSANCLQVSFPGTYSAKVGKYTLSLAVPAGAAAGSWHGFQDRFYLANAPCGSDAEIVFRAQLLDWVNADPCAWSFSQVEVRTAADAVAELSKLAITSSGATGQGQLADLDAPRLEFEVPAGQDPSACTEGMIALWPGMPIEPGQHLQAYVLDLEGTPVVITAKYAAQDDTPAIRVRIADILGTLGIGA